MKQKHVTNLIKASMIVGGLGMSFAATQLEAEAHGWIVNDRAHLGSNRGGNRNGNMGNITFEPQSVGEAGRQVVELQRASLNDAISARSGQLGGFPAISQHGGNGRTWVRTNMNTGPNTLTWNFTAAHRTNTINYYITRQGFDYRLPLNYADFDWIQTFSYGGNSPAATNTAHRHNITIPSDRTGNHVILAAWHVGDASVTWYRVIDITLPGVTGPFTPTPERLLPILEAPAWRPNNWGQGERASYNGYVWRVIRNHGRAGSSNPPAQGLTWERIGRSASVHGTGVNPAPAQPAPTQPAPAQPAPTQPAPAQPAPAQQAPTLDQQYVQLMTAMNGATPMAAVGNRIELGLGQSIQRQTFRFIRSGSSYLIQSVEDGRFLTEQSQAVALTDQSSANSLWNLVDYADGSARLRNNATQRFMDVSGGNTTADGTQIITWTGHNGANQRWLINITESPIVEVPVIVEPVQPEVVLPEVVAPAPVQPEVVAPAPVQPEVVAPAQPEVEVESGLPVMSAQAWTHGSVLRGHLRSYRGFVYEARFNLSGQMNSPVNRPDRWIRVGRTQ